MRKSIERTKKIIKIMEAFVSGDRVQSQHKGFSMWSDVGEVGIYRHQWDTRNENYRVLDGDGGVVLECGEEFDERDLGMGDVERQFRAVEEAMLILTDSFDKKAWFHYCWEIGGSIVLEIGDNCQECGEKYKVKLSVI